MKCRTFQFPAGRQFRAQAPLRIDFVGMSDFFPCFGRNVNAAINNLSADLYATSRDDDLIKVCAGDYGSYEMSLSAAYGRDDHEQMFPKALKMYPDCRLESGLNVWIDCQYDVGGLSTSSSVAAAIHALLQTVFDQPANLLDMVWRVIRTEPDGYGRQDQLAVVFGGINMWEMDPEDEYSISTLEPTTFHREKIRQWPIVMTDESLSRLNQTVMIYESGIRENAVGILQDVANGFLKDPVAQQAKFEKLNELAFMIRDCFRNQHANVVEFAEAFGPVLNNVKEVHASLHEDVMNQRMHDLFEAASAAGATGGRINGAGRRGTIQLAVPPYLHAEVQHALDQVDTPGPGSRKKLKGKLIEHGGFGGLGARGWLC